MGRIFTGEEEVCRSYSLIFILSPPPQEEKGFLPIVVVVQLFANPWTAARQVSLSLITSQSLPKFMSIASIMPSSHLIVWHSFLPSVFPSIRNFPKYWLFTSGDQNTGASAAASVLSISTQGWFPLRSTSLINLLYKGLSGVFSSTTVWRHQSFGTLPSLRFSSHNLMGPLGRP